MITSNKFKYHQKTNMVVFIKFTLDFVKKNILSRYYSCIDLRFYRDKNQFLDFTFIYKINLSKFIFIFIQIVLLLSGVNIGYQKPLMAKENFHARGFFGKTVSYFGVSKRFTKYFFFRFFFEHVSRNTDTSKMNSDESHFQLA